MSDHLDAATLKLCLPGVADQITYKAPLLRRLVQKHQTSIQGGSRIQKNLDSKLNPNIGWGNPKTNIPILGHEFLRSAYWDWAFLRGPLELKDHDQDTNRGKAKQVDLLKSLQRNMYKSIGYQMESGLFGYGGITIDGGYMLDGLLRVCDDGSYHGATYGDITRANDAWWNASVDATTTTLTAPVFTNAITQLSVGCTAIYTTPTQLNNTIAVWDGQQYYVNDSEPDFGVKPSFRVLGLPMYASKYCPVGDPIAATGTMFFLNEDDFELITMAGYNDSISVDDNGDPYGFPGMTVVKENRQTGGVADIWTVRGKMQLVCYCPSNQHVKLNLTQTLAS